MRVTQVVTWAAILWLAASSSADAQRARGRTAVRIGVVADGPSEALDTLNTMVRSEVIDLLGEQREVTYPEQPTHADWTPAGIRAVVETALADREIDVLIGLGVGTGAVVATIESLPKPVFLPVTITPAAVGLPNTDGRSGRSNLNYLTGLNNYERDLVRFAEVASFSNVVVFVDENVENLLPDFDDNVRAAARDLGLGVTLVNVSGSASGALDGVPDDAEAVYLTALPRFTNQELSALIEGLNERRLPTFSSLGPTLVELGALATVTPMQDWTRRARRVALNLQRVLEGENASTLSVVFEPDEELVVNMATARRIGVYPTWQVISEARLINQDREDEGDPMTVRQAVDIALGGNLDLQSGQRRVEAGAEDILRARAPLLPTISSEAAGSYRDPEGASFFGEQELNARWSISATQIIFAESPWAQLVATEHQQESREQEYATTVLDTTLGVIEAYIDVLRASAAERIERENLISVRSNFATATVRLRIGVGRMEEVHRWEIEIANSRRSVINAIARRNQAEIQLNRLLNRPLEARVNIADVDLPGVQMWEDRTLTQYLNNPWGFAAFRDFMAAEALLFSPELQQFDALIASQQRILEGQRRVLWAPTVALSGSVSHIFLREGEGKNDPSMGMSGLPPQNDLDYRIGLAVTLPLFEGAGRLASIRQSEAVVSQLRFDRASVVQQVEQRVRVTLHQAGASRPGYELATQAATAARENLALVRDAYARGAVNIITVVDAQTQANRQSLAAAGALYDFLLDYARSERAMGRFVFQMNDEDRQDLSQRFITFATERRDRERRARGESP